MLRLTLRSLFERKVRLALTTFAVVLGVSFVVGSFVLADSLRATFDRVADDIAGPISVQIRGIETFEGELNSRSRVPETLLEEIRRHPDVAAANGFLQGTPSLSVGEDFATQIGAPGPILAFNYEPSVTPFEIVAGARPGSGEALIDAGTADRYGLAIGDEIAVRSLIEPRVFEISGMVRFGSNDGTGARFILFDTPTTQELFAYNDAFMVIDAAAAPGVTKEHLALSLNALLPETAEAVVGDVVAEEFSSEFGTFINIFQNALLAFAFVALLVSAFIINNTFAIVLGQRVKELGLLRVLGATGRQIRQSVLIEALLIGAGASLVGILGGVGVAMFLKAIIGAIGDGDGLPDGPLIIAARTWIAAGVVGIGVTLLAALAPAVKAARVSPMAALREASLSGSGVRVRTITGSTFGLTGIVAVAVGLTSDDGAVSQLLALAAGAVLVFISVAALSPLIARPIARLIGSPVALAYGTTGHLARENAARNPRRTAATASALMVGLALVTTVLVVGTSFKETFASVLDRSLQADFFIDLESRGSNGFSPRLADELATLPEIEAAAGFRGGPGIAAMRVQDDLKDVLGVDQIALGSFVDLDLSEGSYEHLGNDGILVHRDPANDLDLSAGDKIEATFPIGGTRSLRVVGIFEDASLLGNWVISLNLYEQVYDSPAQLDLFAAAVIADNVDMEKARLAVDEVASAYPEARLQDRDEFQATLEGRIDQALATVSVLLLVSVIIAILGIVNTLLLSVYERTREIGLVRAIGMTRKQVRRVIRWESVIVAVFGGVLGITLGLVFGFIATTALPDSFILQTGVPVLWLVLVLLACVVAGLIAALLPAYRASRLNVLEAIAHD